MVTYHISVQFSELFQIHIHDPYHRQEAAHSSVGFTGVVRNGITAALVFTFAGI